MERSEQKMIREMMRDTRDKINNTTVILLIVR